FLYPIYPLICVAASAVIECFPEFFRDKYNPNDQSVLFQIAKYIRPLVLGLILCASHARTFSLIHGYSAPLEIYKHLEHHGDAGLGENSSVVCVGSEWHRFPSSFFVPDYVGQVRWLDDGFRGLLPLPFNSSLGGTSAAPSYFNNKNKASDKQYLHDPERCNFLIELQLQRPYPSRGSDLSTWEVISLSLSPPPSPSPSPSPSLKSSCTSGCCGTTLFGQRTIASTIPIILHPKLLAAEECLWLIQTSEKNTEMMDYVQVDLQDF
ncbi:hypothetical protein RJ640_004353, partial [Escallonia rubra]